MLTALHIENIAVVEKTDINFDNGFNVLTGETGAGKSIVIDAISAVLGERTSHDLIRTGANNAVVSAVFEDVNSAVQNVLRDMDYPCDDNSLVIIRKISADGKNSVKINGMPATVGVLKKIGSTLVNIHGQHDSQHLLDPAKHIDYIDAMCENCEVLDSYRVAFNEYKLAKSKLNELEGLSQQRQQRADYLRYAVNELESAQLEIGERDELIKHRDLIRNSAEIAGKLSNAIAILNGDEYSQNVSSALKNSANIVLECSKYIPELKDLSEQLLSFGYETEELSASLEDKLAKTEYNPNLLESIEARLDYIFRLSKKYGATEEEMLNYLNEAKTELDSLDNYEQQLLSLNQLVEDKTKALLKISDHLTSIRSTTSNKFANDVCAQLEFLDMPNAKLKVNVERIDFTSNGCDNIEFLISTNSGETLKPLAKIASGGELSRIMLAIKSVLANKDDVDTLIFDEIDTGISGSAARKVGNKIKHISSDRQIICVTHLAQIASLADVHFLISKTDDGQHTFTDVTQLDRDGRVEEIARIMSTGVMTDAIKVSAAELIDMN